MSYLVLARKYRPVSFAGIVGQDHIVRTLKNAIALERVHHAFLFTGARGVGKTTMARVLARALNCAQGPTAEPCGACAPCLEIGASTSPDVLEIDGASNTGVDNVRELREAVRYMPQKGRFKLYIIDEVHMLSKGAFNALLKTLEEPPPHVKFIFATTEPQKIPVTILSRCQRFDFRRISMPVLAEQLRFVITGEGVELSPTAVTAIVREAQGSVRDALSLLDQVLSYAGDHPGDAEVVEALGVVDRETIFALAQSVLERDADRLLGLVAEIDTRGHDLADVGGLLVEHLRDVMVVAVAADPAPVLQQRSPGEVEALRAQAERRDRADLHRLFALSVTLAEDVSRSAHPRVSLEMGLLRLLEVEPAQSLAILLGRLDELVGDCGPVGAKASAKTPAVGAGASADRPPVNDGEAPTDWNRLVERIRELRPALASVLEHGRVLRFGPGGVELGFPADTFYWDSARDAGNRGLLQQTLDQQFGQAVRLSLQALEDQTAGAPSIAEVSERSTQKRLEAIRKDALEHPVVISATEILGGKIKQVVALIEQDERAEVPARVAKTPQ